MFTRDCGHEFTGVGGTRIEKDLRRRSLFDDPALCITAISSQIWLATRRSWVMKIIATPVSRWMRSRSSRICAWIDTSSAETGFIGDQQFRLEHQRPRYSDALALSAGELVRISLEGPRIEADQVQERVRLVASPGLGHAMSNGPDSQDRADRHARVERGKGILKDHLDLRPQASKAAFVQRRNIGPVEYNPPAIGIQEFDQ